MATCGAVPAVLRVRPLAALGVLLALLGCSRAQPRPSVLLISIDTLRADHLGCYGHFRPTSPNLDAVAGSGVLFEHTYSPSSWTLPGHASMLSGVSPFRHGATHEARRIRSDVKLLPEILRAHGYQTAAIINAPFVQGKYGFSRGFDRFVESFDKKSEDYLPQVLGFLEGLGDRPFFAFVHFMNVHSPYTPPLLHRFDVERGPTPAADGRHLMELDRSVRAREVQLTEPDRDYLAALYDGEIRAVDQMVAEAIARARERARGRLLVVVTSDHGEEFLEHGGLLHGQTLYDEALHVPLIIAGPGVPAGRRVGRLSSLLDVAPTILGLLGIAAPSGLEGRALLSSSPGQDRNLAVPLQTSAHDGTVHLRGLRTASRKLIADDNSDQALSYDLGQDPKERHPVPAGPADPLLSLLLGLRVAASSEARAPEGPELEALRALGYHK